MDEQAARIAYLENLNLDLTGMVEALERRNAELRRENAGLRAALEAASASIRPDEPD